MKTKVFFRVGLMLLWLAASTGCNRQVEKTEMSSKSFASAQVKSRSVQFSEVGEDDAVSNTVYVCQSSGAKKYHYSSSCRGLSNCKHEIVTMAKKEAENIGLGLCGWED